MFNGWIKKKNRKLKLKQNWKVLDKPHCIDLTFKWVNLCDEIFTKNGNNFNNINVFYLNQLIHTFWKTEPPFSILISNNYLYTKSSEKWAFEICFLLKRSSSFIYLVLFRLRTLKSFQLHSKLTFRTSQNHKMPKKLLSKKYRVIQLTWEILSAMLFIVWKQCIWIYLYSVHQQKLFLYHAKLFQGIVLMRKKSNFFYAFC